MILALLEDYLPYHSEASVDWRELLHNRADDGSWSSQPEPDGTLSLTVGRPGSGDVDVKSRIPTMKGSLGFLARVSSAPLHVGRAVSAIGGCAVPTSGMVPGTQEPALRRDRAGMFVGLAFGLGLIAITWGVVYVLLRYMFSRA